MMKDCVVTLYEGNYGINGWRDAKASFSQGCFSLHATEEGEQIEKVYGTEESEYVLSLDEEQTERFLQVIMKEEDTPEETIRRELGGEDCVGKFYDLCKQNSINYKLNFIW